MNGYQKTLGIGMVIFTLLGVSNARSGAEMEAGITMTQAILEAQTTQATCLRCHGMRTLGYRDPVTGGMIDLHVPGERFRDSNHRQLNCIECHTAGFENYPHPDKAKQQSLYCVDCHEENPELIPIHFAEIEREFKASVHFQRMPEDFSCFSCHDAHYFKASRTGSASDPNRFPNKERCLSCHPDEDFEVGGMQRDISQMVAYDNHICLSCHAVPSRIADLKSSDPPDINSSHDWLPNVAMHWEKVRCIDCHLSTSDNYLHEILTADQAVKHCEDCHSANSILLTKLYKYNIQETRQKYGFMNSIALNEAYIIGMTRNIILDRLSFIILGLMVIGLFAHGGARWLSGRRRNR